MYHPNMIEKPVAGLSKAFYRDILSRERRPQQAGRSSRARSESVSPAYHLNPALLPQLTPRVLRRTSLPGMSRGIETGLVSRELGMVSVRDVIYRKGGMHEHQSCLDMMEELFVIMSLTACI